MRLGIITILLLINSLVLAQSSDRAWVEGELSWGDFKGKEQKSKGLVFRAYIITGSVLRMENDTNYREFHTRAMVQKNLSWVNPSDQGEELLDYAQLLFDVTKLYADLLEKELEESGVRKNVTAKTRRFNEINARQLARIQEESSKGRNQIVVKRWKAWLRREQKKLSRRKPVIYKRSDFAFRAGLGTGTTIYTGDLGSNVTTAAGLHFSTAVLYKDYEFSYEYFGNNPHVSPGLNYDGWGSEQGLKHKTHVFLAGYNQFSTDKYRLTYVLGLALSKLKNRSFAVENKEDRVIRDITPILGIQLSRHFNQLESRTPHPKFGLRYFVENSLCLKAMLSFPKFVEDGREPVIGLALAYHLGGRRVKNIKP